MALLAVTVMLYDPAGVEAVVNIVSVELRDDDLGRITLAGLTEAVNPVTEGIETDNEMVPEKLLIEVRVIVDVVDPLAKIETEDGLEEIEKSGPPANGTTKPGVLLGACNVVVRTIVEPLGVVAEPGLEKTFVEPLGVATESGLLTGVCNVVSKTFAEPL